MALLLKQFEFVRPDDPTRCQAVEKKSQCKFKSVEGTNFCQRHGYNSGSNARQREAVNLYFRTQYAARIEEQSEHPKIKSLRDEIGVLRLTLETQLTRATNDDELLLRSGKIVELVREIRSTVNDCHKLDMSLKSVLDAGQAKEFIQDVANIVGLYIENKEYIQMIADHMLTALEERLGNNKIT